MWFNYKLNTTRKWAALFLVSILCTVLGLIVWKASNLDWVKAQVQTILKGDAFSSLQVESMDVAWAGLSLRVTLHEAQIIDEMVKVPFFSAKKLEIDVSILTWLFSHRVAINKVMLDQSALVLSVDLDRNIVEVLGLKREVLPQTINMQQVLGGLSHLDKIEINHLEIAWITPLGKSEQQVSGTWAWKNKARQTWKFKGTHVLLLGKNLPVFSQSIVIQAIGLYQKIKWSLSGSSKDPSFSGNWTVSPNEVLRWDLSLKNMSVSPLHAILGALNKSTAVKKIPPWLSWLDGSIKKGLISHLYWNHGDRTTGEIHFEETDLQYHPDWPTLKNIEGKWLFIDGVWQLEVTEAQIQGIPVATLLAEGKVKNDAVYEVTVDGKVVSTLNKGVDFLGETPLKNTAYDALYRNHLMGDMDLTLHLNIPIGMPTKNKSKTSASLPITVKGNILANNLSLYNDDWGVRLSNGHGKINFTETGVESVLNEIALLVPKAWPLDWPSAGRLVFALSWDNSADDLFFSGRFANAWDAKTTWRKGLLVNGEVLLDPQKNETSHWPATKEQTVLIVSKQFEARVQTNNWARVKKTDPIKLELSFLKCPLGLSLSEAVPDAGDTGMSKMSNLSSLVKKPIYFTSQSTWLGSYFLGKIHFQANPEAEGWKVIDLRIEQPNFSLNATGFWSIIQDTTTLSGTMSSPHIGNLLSDWDAGGSNLKEGHMQTAFSVQWPGNPTRFSWMNLSGEVNVDINNGRLLGIDVGFGRLLGLLSMDNLKRRLQLDFRDVFKKGFVFDRAEAKLKLSDETWFLKWAKVKAPTADLVSQGSTNIKTEALSLFIKVIPKSAVSGVPVAAAIAGGPALGAGLWVFDKVFMGSQYRKSAGIFYEVSGTWDKPVVKKVSFIEMVEP
jgi:hypothetical protein